jgi:hypothetical protein
MSAPEWWQQSVLQVQLCEFSFVVSSIGIGIWRGFLQKLPRERFDRVPV